MTTETNKTDNVSIFILVAAFILIVAQAWTDLFMNDRIWKVEKELQEVRDSIQSLQQPVQNVIQYDIKIVSKDPITVKKNPMDK